MAEEPNFEAEVGDAYSEIVRKAGEDSQAEVPLEAKESTPEPQGSGTEAVIEGAREFQAIKRIASRLTGSSSEDEEES